MLPAAGEQVPLAVDRVASEWPAELPWMPPEHKLQVMKAEEALERQMARYREMTREERVKIALGLHDLACEMARLGIRRQHPSASAAEVEALLRQRLELARNL